MMTTEFSRWVLQVARRLIGAWLFALGLILVIFGDSRIQGTAYRGMRSFAHSVNASPSLLWGIAAMVAGVLIWPNRTRLIGLFLGLFWVILYGLGFWLSVTDQRTSATAGPTYTFIALFVAGVTALERDRRP